MFLRYYGYRNVDGVLDTRIEIFQEHKHLFHNKDVLDIGCNIGHITYLVARDLGARTVLGLDIDNSLIQIARKNVKYYSCLTSPSDLLSKCNIRINRESNQNDVLESSQSDVFLNFPNNVSFLHVRAYFLSSLCIVFRP